MDTGIAADRTSPARVERVLASGRAFLTVSGLVAIYLDPTEPARLAELTYAVLAAYALYSVLALVVIHRARRVQSSHGLVLQGLDILWTSILTFVSQGPVSPFFLFFVFTVVAAAYRWGFAGTMVTVAVTVAIFLLQTAVGVVGPWRQTWMAVTDFELNRTILRVAYLLLTGFLLGYLAEQDKRFRAELAIAADLTRQPRAHLGLGGSISTVLAGLLRVFGAEKAFFVLQDYESRDTFLWQVDPSTPSGEAPRTQLDAAQQRAWLFADPGRVWEGTPNGAGASRVHIVEPDTWPLRRGHLPLTPILAGTAACGRVIVANLGLADEWRGRIYLCDPALGRSIEEPLHFLDALVEQISPAITNVFLLGRLRARVTAAERARVSRELHDGAIQALIGIEMKVEALRRAPEPVPPDAQRELHEIQELLRGEVLALRELMQALRPISLDASDQLPDVLGSVVERFRRDTGVSARFVGMDRPPLMPPAAALEFVRIVQEALVNVRKHSRARNVLVRLAGAEQRYTLVIEDDGVGCGFEGALSAEELDRRRLGPAIIRERARIAGARLSITSGADAGTRIELLWEGRT